MNGFAEKQTMRFDFPLGAIRAIASRMKIDWSTTNQKPDTNSKYDK